VRPTRGYAVEKPLGYRHTRACPAYPRDTTGTTVEREADTRTGDFTLTLNRTGVSVFSYSEAGSMQSFVHLGTNVVSPPTGRVYDQYDLAYSLTSV